MSSISECYRKISKYKTLKENINSISSKLLESYNSTSSLVREISDKYNLNDDRTSIEKRSTDLKDAINNEKNYLEDTVIPAINEAISDLYDEIERLEEDDD